MATDPNTAAQSAPRGPAPLAPAVRSRLQKVYEHAQRCVEKDDFDYAHQLFTQCVSEDPANIAYLQAMLANLQKKHGNNKKGSTLASLKIKGPRSTLAKAAAKGDWLAAFQAGCAALAIHPWDVPTLQAMASACSDLHIDECQLYYLRWALDVAPKDPAVNKQAAQALQRMGQFDQAIACWRRVELARPQDEEARQAVARLSVEKTIHQGGYDPDLLTGAGKGGAGAGKSPSVAGLSRGAGSDQGDEDHDAPAAPTLERLEAAAAADPTDLDAAFRLADLYIHQQRLDDAGRVLDRARQATGGGDLRVRERLEDLQLRRAAHQAQLALKNYEHEQTTAARELLEKARAHANQVELEIFAARVDREPHSTRLRFELGLRQKKASKIKEAITSFQAARGDSKKKTLVLVELGECFQKIEQYKLALSHYEQAIEGCDPADLETRKLALYRAGVLATGLRELDRAERHLQELGGLDFSYRDVADRLDKIGRLRDSG